MAALHRHGSVPSRTTNAAQEAGMVVRLSCTHARSVGRIATRHERLVSGGI
ncbi:hypothetical protein [Streptomyces canus]|uniref:hypothetical protein n=1 Tax=Streptomyces canus TaxID=58343 RepID=UPI0033A07F3C